MFARLTNSRLDSNYESAARRALFQAFGLTESEYQEQTVIWAEWLKKVEGDYQALVKFLVDEKVSEGFRARALMMLLSPKMTTCGLAQVPQHLFGDKQSGCKPFDFATLPEKLQRLSWQLILLGTKLSFKKSPERDIGMYQVLIQQALAVLEEGNEIAEGMFALYPLNDPIPYGGMEESSGYNPFQSFLMSSAKESWKVRLDEKMRLVVLEECQGLRVPREKHEAALECYALLLRFFFDSKRSRYSRTFLASQIEFVLCQSEKFKRGVYWDYHFPKMISKFSGSEYKELRRKIARHFAFGRLSFGVFSLHDKEDVACTQSLIEEFQGEDNELVSALVILLSVYEARRCEENRMAQIQKKENEALLNKMR